MKSPRTLWSLVTLFLLVICSAVPLRAQNVIWTGAGTPIMYGGPRYEVIDPANWSNSPPFVGSGTDDVEFGNVASGLDAVWISEATALRHITFNNTSTVYHFNGDGDGSYLLFNGDLSAGVGSTATFHDDFPIYLSTGSHTASIGAGSTITIESNIYDDDGASSIIKTGTGTLILSGANQFSNGVMIQAGTLLLGSSSGSQEFDDGDGGTFINYYGPVGGTGTLTLAAGTTLGLASSEGTYSLDNGVTLSSGLVTVDTGSDNQLDLNSTITGSGGLSVTGTGSLRLYGNNVFTGGLTVNSGAIVDFGDGSNAGTGTLTLAGGSEINSFQDGDMTIANAVTLTGGGDNYAHIEDESSGMKFTGLISGAGGIDWCTSSTLTLMNAANTFAGGVYMREGTLLLGASSTGPAGSPTAGPAGTGGIILTGNTSIGVESTAGSVTLHNNVSVSSNEETPAYLSGSTHPLTIAGTISGSGVLRTTGSVTLTGSNTFNGELYSNGTLNLADNSASQAVVALGASSTVNFTGMAPAIHALEADSGSDTVTLMSGSTLTINQTNTSENYDFQGTLTGSAGVVKSGAGTQIFSHANTYSGGTTISGGTLVANHGNGSNVVDALGAVGGTVTINGGKLQIGAGLTLANPLVLTSGTLGGNYTFTTPQSFGAGITLAPGNSPGTMTFAAGYAPTNGVSTNFEFNDWTDSPGVNSDLIAITGGTFDLTALSAGGYTLHLISLSLIGGNTAGPIDGTAIATTWTIFTSPTTLSPSDLTKFTLESSAFTNPGNFSLGLAGANQNIVLNFSPVPEPSTYALLALGLFGTGFAAWRKRPQA